MTAAGVSRLDLCADFDDVSLERIQLVWGRIKLNLHLSRDYTSILALDANSPSMPKRDSASGFRASAPRSAPVSARASTYFGGFDVAGMGLVASSV